MGQAGGLATTRPNSARVEWWTGRLVKPATGRMGSAAEGLRNLTAWLSKAEAEAAAYEQLQLQRRETRPGPTAKAGRDSL